MSARETSWTEERVRWENAHPEWGAFAEDEGSQRQLISKEVF